MESANISALDGQTALGMARAQALPRVPHGTSPEKMRKVAEEFEGVFLAQMLKPVFDELNAEEPFGGGQAEQMYRSLMVDEYGKSIAKAGGIGLADAVLAQMLKLQEVQ